MKKENLADWIEAITSRFGYGYTQRQILKIRKIEKKTGADFGGGVERIFQEDLGYSKEEGNDYTLSPNEYLDVICDGRIPENEAILDMGCGKGYAMYAMGKCPFSHIYGVEKSALLAQIARDNLERTYPNDNRFEVYDIDATEMFSDEHLKTILRSTSNIYIYNSFPRNVMHKVVKGLENLISQSKYDVTVWYAAPSMEPLREMMLSEYFDLVDVHFTKVHNYRIFEFKSKL